MPHTTSVIDSVHTLERTDMSRKQAEALIQLLRDSIAEAVQHLATKAEVEAQLLAIRAEFDAQFLAIKAELAELRQHMATHMATKAELAALEAQVMEIKAELVELRQNMVTRSELAALEARVMAHTDAQIALLRGEINEKMATNLKYTVLTIGFSTVAIIVAIFTALFAMPTGI